MTQIKDVFIKGAKIEKIFNSSGVLWQYRYGKNTVLIFKGDTATLEIARLPKEITGVIQGTTLRYYEENGIYFSPMWTPYDDQHQYYTGTPAYTGTSTPNMLSDYVSQAPASYSIANGNLMGTMQTSLIDNGTKLQFKFVNTGFTSPWQYLPTKYVKLSFKL